MENLLSSLYKFLKELSSFYARTLFFNDLFVYYSK